MIPVAAVFMVPFAAVSAIANTWSFAALDDLVVDPQAPPTAAEVGAIFGPIVVLGLLTLLIFPLVSGAISWAAAQFYLGEDPPAGRIVRFAFSKFPALLLVSILTGLAVTGGFLLLVVPGIIFLVRFLLSPSAVVVEDTSAVEGMRRSWRLIKGYFWKVVGASLLAVVIVAIVQAIIDIPFQIAVQFFYAQQSWALAAALGFIGTAVSGTLVTPLSTIVQVLIYFDLRIRKEGMDLSLMAQQLESGTASPGPPDEPSTGPPAPPSPGPPEG